MNTSAFCFACLIQKQEQAIRHFSDEAKKSQYMRLVLKTLADAKEEDSTPYYSGLLSRLYRSFWGENEKFYEGDKLRFNRMMLDEEAALEQEITTSADPLITAIQIARAGNYIDFGALSQVEEERLAEILSTAHKDTLPPEEYQRFVKELSCAKRLVYLTDNCGEIVLDKLLIRQLKKQFPQLSITAIVRGEPVLNDATYTEAEQVGLTEHCTVIGNGTDYAGTILSAISPESKAEMDAADLIIAKGQGNFESLHGCGKNIYYLLLCKCEWFVKQFHMKRYAGVFCNERRLPDSVKKLHPDDQTGEYL